jgi:hypothetical protein
MTSTENDAPTGIDSAGELRRAELALTATLTAARKADPTLRPKDLTSLTVEVVPPYAREARLLASTVAGQRHVLVVATPRAAGGEYRRGADLLFLGYRPAVEQAAADFTAIWAAALAAAKQATPAPGEDMASTRSSFLLGYRIGLARPGLDAETVVAAVTAPGKAGIRVGSTGTASWAGYSAAREISAAAAA